MNMKLLKMEIINFIGGEENIISFYEKDRKSIYISVKDQSQVNLSALKKDIRIKSCILKSGHLQLLLKDKQEEEKVNMQNNKYQELAAQIVENVGGKDNIKYAIHCMTRLRLNLLDNNAVNLEKLKNIEGVLGCQKVGEQTQIIIGQDVDKLYEVFCEQADIKKEGAIEENLDGKSNEKWTSKRVINNIFDYLSGSLLVAIPILCGGAIFKVLLTILGPSVLNIIAQDSNMSTLLTVVGDAAFYFLPVYIGYSATKKLGGTPILGMLLGGILIHPTIVDMATKGTWFSVYGIPSKLNNYTSTVIPILLSVPIMVYLEKTFKKYVPQTLQILFVPFLTIAIMLPITLCVLAPAGSYLGVYICNFIISLHDSVGVVAVGIVGATFMLLVLTGMHILLVTQIILLFSTTGYDPFVSVAIFANTAAAWGICVGVALKGNKELRTRSIGYLIPYVLSGVGEPILYGLAMKYRKLFIAWMAGGFAGGVVAGILNVTAYSLIPTSSFLGMAAYINNGMGNIIRFAISLAVGFVVATIIAYIVGPGKEEKVGDNVVV